MENLELMTFIEQIKQQHLDYQSLSPSQLAQNEDFWQIIRRAYQPSPDFINLENGFYGALPQATLAAQIQHTQEVNALSSFYMRRQQPQDWTNLKSQLAQLIGCQPTEVALARNATEAANVILMGLDWQSGDEIVAAVQDYPAVLEAIEQRVRRSGIRSRLVSIPLHPQSDAEIVDLYAQAITPQTKLLVITHLIHWTGQILPVRAICEMAQARGVEVLVDSAHGFAQLDFNIRDIGCDYWIANLHKWLAAPLTGGVIAIKPEKIAKIWPLLGDTTYAVDDIRKLEHFSALPMPIYLTIFEAIQLHQAIGGQYKQARLHYLKSYWTSRVKNLPKVQINTPLAEGKSNAIANFSIEGKSAVEVATQLLDQYRIFAAGFETPFLSGVRITPNLYNSLADLDSLVNAIARIAQSE
ncbi:MAG: aminotransferase class V-fold PLP-dependent enzyme [Microscillaceae bacterium]|nr:aminotransferase class V-fold PLP-dependent enzyme [Microscillaceae bacterium]